MIKWFTTTLGILIKEFARLWRGQKQESPTVPTVTFSKSLPPSKPPQYSSITGQAIPALVTSKIMTSVANARSRVLFTTGIANLSGGYTGYWKFKCFVLCSNQFSFDTFKALGDLDKNADYVFVDKPEDIGDNDDGRIIMLGDFPLNPNIESILETLGSRLSLNRKPSP